MVLALGPVGCGFQPIYARPGSVASSPMADQLASVRVAAIDDRAGQQLRNNLVLALSPRGEPAAPNFVLTVRLTESVQGMANSKDGNAAIGRLNATATYILTDSAGKIVHSGQSRTASGFRYQGPRYASTVSERDSETLALSEIAIEIRSALAAYFADPETFAQRQKLQQAQPLRPYDAP